MERSYNVLVSRGEVVLPSFVVRRWRVPGKRIRIKAVFVLTDVLQME